MDIIVHIADMIQYRSFNLRSPVNNAAALWAQRNTRSFPIGSQSVLPAENTEPDIEVAPRRAEFDIELGPVRYKDQDSWTQPGRNRE